MDFYSWLVGVCNGAAITFLFMAFFEPVIDRAIRKSVEKAIDRNIKKLF